jgi:hypothetical protein
MRRGVRGGRMVGGRGCGASDDVVAATCDV